MHLTKLLETAFRLSAQQDIALLLSYKVDMTIPILKPKKVLIILPLQPMHQHAMASTSTLIVFFLPVECSMISMALSLQKLSQTQPIVGLLLAEMGVLRS